MLTRDDLLAQLDQIAALTAHLRVLLADVNRRPPTIVTARLAVTLEVIRADLERATATVR